MQEERAKRESEGAEKARRVEELERDIQQTIEGQMRENRELREKIGESGVINRMYQEAEGLLKSHMNLSST